MTSETNEHGEAARGARLEMPAPTFWPIVLAAGCTLVGMGVVTSWLFTYIGIVVFVIALANWLGLLFPGRGHIHEEVLPPERRPTVVRPHGAVEHLRPGMAGHRMRLPEKMHPYSAGVKGGIAGGVAMTIPALLYGLISHSSIWFPINLLAGMVSRLPTLPDGQLDVGRLERFNLRWLLVGLVIHVVTSVSTGLMYGVLLPMLPGRRPIFWGGIVAPLLWTGAVHSFMGVLNPALEAKVNWPSFIAAQFIFGLVCGFVVVRSEQVYTDASSAELAASAGPGTAPPDEGRP